MIKLDDKYNEFVTVVVIIVNNDKSTFPACKLRQV